MTAVTCDFDFFMIPLVHKISNFVFFPIRHSLPCVDIRIHHTHTSARFSVLYPRSIISAVECAAITIYVQEVN